MPAMSGSNTDPAAWGGNAHAVVNNHELEYCLGEHSPLARLYDLDAETALIGVGYEHNTCFHLAEYRSDGAKELSEGAAVMVDGQREWVTYRDIVFHNERFAGFGRRFEQECVVSVGYVGSAQSRLFSLHHAVEFAMTQVELAREEGEPT